MEVHVDGVRDQTAIGTRLVATGSRLAELGGDLDLSHRDYEDIYIAHQAALHAEADIMARDDLLTEGVAVLVETRTISTVR